MNSEWKECKLGDVAEFRNGKKIPNNARDTNGLYNIYGSNGIIGKTNQILYKNETIVIGRVGAYCGALEFSEKDCWISDNAKIGRASCRERV